MKAIDMLWTDVNEIAIELCEKYPEIDTQYVIFTDLRDWVIGLDGFKGHADRSNEKILEAIQMLWIEEMS